MAFAPRHGEPEALARNITRIVAANPSAFTGAGTNTYLLGTRRLMVVDPGPDLAAHVAAIVAAVAGRKVSHVLLTHTHRDHVGALAALHAEVGGEVLAEGPHRLCRPLRDGETNLFEGSADWSFRPDRALSDGEVVDNGDVAVHAVATPGHTANHMAFAVGVRDGKSAADLLSGDHVMGWATSVVAPPDGSMTAYLASLDKLAAMSFGRYLPGHGDVVHEPQRTVAATKAHRLMRERAICERLASGDRTIADVVAALYAGIDLSLRGAAALSVQAHLEKLGAEGRVVSQGAGRTARWWLV